MEVVFEKLDIGQASDGVSGSRFALTLGCVVGSGWSVATIDVDDIGGRGDGANYIAVDCGIYFIHRNRPF